MFMGFWYVGRVGNNSRTHPLLLSRHLTLQNVRNINFLLDFSIFDALDACLMVHGSWFMAHGSWLKAQGSWLMAKGGQERLMAHGQGP